MLTSPIINALLKIPKTFISITAELTCIVVVLFLALIKVQKEINSKWSEAMKDPRWWEKIPWIGVAGIIACITVIIALLLSP